MHLANNSLVNSSFFNDFIKDSAVKCYVDLYKQQGFDYYVFEIQTQGSA